MISRFFQALSLRTKLDPEVREEFDSAVFDWGRTPTTIDAGEADELLAAGRTPQNIDSLLLIASQGERLLGRGVRGTFQDQVDDLKSLPQIRDIIDADGGVEIRQVRPNEIAISGEATGTACGPDAEVCIALLAAIGFEFEGERYALETQAGQTAAQLAELLMFDLEANGFVVEITEQDGASHLRVTQPGPWWPTDNQLKEVYGGIALQAVQDGTAVRLPGPPAGIDSAPSWDLTPDMPDRWKTVYLLDGDIVLNDGSFMPGGGPNDWYNCGPAPLFASPEEE